MGVDHAAQSHDRQRRRPSHRQTPTTPGFTSLLLLFTVLLTVLLTLCVSPASAIAASPRSLRVLAPSEPSNSLHRFMTAPPPAPQLTPHKPLHDILTGILTTAIDDANLWPKQVMEKVGMKAVILGMRILRIRGLNHRTLTLLYDGNEVTPFSMKLTGAYLYLQVQYKFGAEHVLKMKDTLTIVIPRVDFVMRMFHDGMTQRLTLRDFSLNTGPITTQTSSSNPFKKKGATEVAKYLNSKSFTDMLSGLIQKALLSALEKLEVRRDAVDRALLPRASAGETFLQRVQRRMTTAAIPFEMRDQTIGGYEHVTINNLRFTRWAVDTRHVRLVMRGGSIDFTLSDVTVHGSVKLEGEGLPACTADIQLNKLTAVVQVVWNSGTMIFRVKDATVTSHDGYPLWVSLAAETWGGTMKIGAANLALKTALMTQAGQDKFLDGATKALAKAVDQQALARVRDFVAAYD